MIKVKKYTDFKSLYESVRPILEMDEVINNLPLGLLLENLNVECNSDNILLCLFDSGEPKLMVQQMGKAMIVTGDLNYATELAQYFHSNNFDNAQTQAVAYPFPLCSGGVYT